MENILDASEKIECVAGGFKFTEGPVWHPDGFLLLTEIGDPYEIWKVVPGGKKEIYRRDTGRATGLTFDLQGRLIACEQVNRQVTRMEPDGTITPIAQKWQGKRLNRPNDVVGISNGSLYFTNRGAQGTSSEEQDIDYNGVYRISAEGEVSEAVHRYVDPNGLAFSPDEKIFYLINTRPSMHIDAFDVQPDGSLTGQRRFFQFPDDTGKQGFPDGMKVDVSGRVYSTGPGGVWVISPQGKKVGVIPFPEQAINMAWGDGDNKTLYVTAMTSVYRLRTKTTGMKIPRIR